MNGWRPRSFIALRYRMADKRRTPNLSHMFVSIVFMYTERGFNGSLARFRPVAPLGSAPGSRGSGGGEKRFLIEEQMSEMYMDDAELL